MSIPLPRFQPIIPQLQILSISGIHYSLFAEKHYKEFSSSKLSRLYTHLHLTLSLIFRITLLSTAVSDQYRIPLLHYILGIWSFRFLTCFLPDEHHRLCCWPGEMSVCFNYQMNTNDYVVDRPRCEFLLFCDNLLLLPIWRTVMPSAKSVYAMVGRMGWGLFGEYPDGEESDKEGQAWHHRHVFCDDHFHGRLVSGYCTGQILLWIRV